MPRFQLQIREPGAGPRLVPIVEEMTLGHARRADVRLEDPDVGNELFRVGEAEGVVFVEGLSRTGLLRAGSTVIEFGQRVPLAPGAILSVGRTTLSVVDTATVAGNDVERTMVSSGGYRPGTPKPAAPTQQQPPAPAAAPQPAAAPHVDKTQVRAGGYRPGTGAAAPQPPSPEPQPVAPPPPSPPRAQEPPPPQPVAPAAVPLPVEAREHTIVATRGGTGGSAQGESLEARCKATNARLFLKSDSIKRTIRLVAALNRVGRLEGAEVSIPNKAVSEQHAEIRFDGANWQLRDCGSTNGTTLDGAAVALDPKPLHNNSFVTFGIFRAVFLCHDAEGKDRPSELRAVRWLAQQGKLPKQVAQELTTTCRNDPSLSVAEVLLRETPVDPSDWGAAMQAARKPAGPVGSILSMLSRVFSR